MKFKDWINLPINDKDILLRCSDPTGLDADNPIYLIGCAKGFNQYIKSNSTINFTNHPQVNTELLFNCFSTHTDRHRKNINRLKQMQMTNNIKIAGRSDYADNLNKNFKSISYSSDDYFNNIGKYKFVASPTGNGLDCHRHYETLISKGIPIIDYHPFLVQKFKGLPILWTNDYSEITPDYLNNMYEKFLNMEFDFRRLLFSYYAPNIRREILIIRQHQAKHTTGLRNKQYWKFSDYFK